MNTDFIANMPMSGCCNLDIELTCSQDWLPKIDKSGSKLCRDAFITHCGQSNEYRLCFVRGYKFAVKVTISECDAEEIINKLGLTHRENKIFGNNSTYRITWFHIDKLNKKTR